MFEGWEVDGMDEMKIFEGYGSDCPFPFFEESPRLCKIYNDGGHYIATRCCRSATRSVTHRKTREDIDILFDDLYVSGVRENLHGEALAARIKAGLEELFSNRPNLDEYVADKIERARRNLYARKKRFRRKAHLNKWNYFVTFTYDDGKQNEETFRKRLRKCLSNLHIRRGWRCSSERPKRVGYIFMGSFMFPTAV